MFINIEEVKIYYEIHGEGRPIVLLHGWGQSVNTFNSLASTLKNNFKVLVIDLPGFGKSIIDKPIDIKRNAQILKKLFLELEIVNPIILAHSYGGRIGVNLVNLYSVDKLILVGVPLLKEKLSLKKRVSIITYKTLKKFNINLNMGSSDYKNASPVLKQMLVMAVNTDLKEELLKICCPTLLMYGEHDIITTPKMALKSLKYINNSGVVTIPNSAHFCYLDNKYYFNTVLNKFIGDNYDT